MDWDTMSGTDKREFLIYVAAVIAMSAAVVVVAVAVVAAVVYAPWYIKPIAVALSVALVLTIASAFYGD
jgi:hypothetical protein|nr:MAG TPA: hypothetical protein [Caudoviricetes sp.]